MGLFALDLIRLVTEFIVGWKQCYVIMKQTLVTLTMSSVCIGLVCTKLIAVCISPPDIMDPIVTSSSVTATTATIALAQPMGSLPLERYTVTLIRSG